MVSLDLGVTIIIYLISAIYSFSAAMNSVEVFCGGREPNVISDLSLISVFHNGGIHRFRQILCFKTATKVTATKVACSRHSVIKTQRDRKQRDFVAEE